MDYENCIVYQCLVTICNGAEFNSKKFIEACLNCPCFRKWREQRKEKVH